MDAPRRSERQSSNWTQKLPCKCAVQYLELTSSELARPVAFLLCEVCWVLLL